MRTSTLALVGLVAAATALPASQGNSRITKRDEILGRETYVTPLQVREPQRSPKGGYGEHDDDHDWKDRDRSHDKSHDRDQSRDRGPGGGNNGGSKNGGGNGNKDGSRKGDGPDFGNGGGFGGGFGGGNNGGPGMGKGGNNGGGNNRGHDDHDSDHRGGKGGGSGSGGGNGSWGGGDHNGGGSPPTSGGGWPPSQGGGSPSGPPASPHQPPSSPPHGPPSSGQPDMPPMDDFPDSPEHEITEEDIKKAQQELEIMEKLLPTITDPEQKKAIESGIEQLKSFLAQYGNGKVTVDTTGPPGVISTFTPGKNKRHETPEDMFLILDQWNTMTKEHYSKSHPPPAPVYLVACQLAELLKEEGYDIDTSILDVWSTFKISDRSIQARQDGIFALPGSCNIDDIIGLETILATIILIYGEDPPQHINSLRNAVLAALLFCGVADAETGGIIPDRPGQGSPVVPDYPSPGGPMVPDKPSSGGSVVPDQPESGGAIVPDKPSSGGRMNPDQPDQGGSINPDPPSEGGRLIPSD